jgi:hypothetical protein
VTKYSLDNLQAKCAMEHTRNDPLARKAGNTDEEESERLLQLSYRLPEESSNLERQEPRFTRFPLSHAVVVAAKRKARLKLQAKITKMKQDANIAFQLH